jgi:hypothetical protein
MRFTTSGKTTIIAIMMISEIPAPCKFPFSFDMFSPPFKTYSIEIVK